MSGQIFWSVLAAMLVYSTYEELLSWIKNRILSRKLDRAMQEAFEKWDNYIESGKSKGYKSTRRAKTTIKVND